MKNYYSYLKLSIAFSCVIVGILIINVTLIKPGKVIYSDVTTNISNWTYSTNHDERGHEISLPWLPTQKSNGTIVYLKTFIPQIDSNKSLVIDSYMKNVRVYINKRIIYDSNIEDPRIISKGIGRGLYFVDIPVAYSGGSIELEITSPFPQNQGEIKSVYLGDRANHITKLIREYGMKNVIAFSMVFMGIIACGIYLSTFSRSREYINLACLGSFLILCGGWIIVTTKLYQIVYSNSYFGYIIEFFCYYAMPIPLIAFILLSCRIKRRDIAKGLLAMFSGLLLFATLSQVLGLINMHNILPIYNCLFVVGMIFITYILISEILRKNEEIYLFAFGCLSMIICCILDIVKFYLAPIKSADGVYMVGIIIFVISVTISMGRYIKKLNKEKIRNVELEMLAYRDIRTGVYNRTKFDKDMNIIDNKLLEHTSICITVVDVDNLKRTNDTDGHLAGDRLICETASILQRSFDQVGTVYRIGGDEFVIICINQENEKIEECDNMRNNIIEDARCKSLAMSCGRSFYIKGVDEDVYCAFVRADQLMYANKRKRKEDEEKINRY
ncbi:MAG: diguanylate cyclase [Clostridium sp.]